MQLTLRLALQLSRSIDICCLERQRRCAISLSARPPSCTAITSSSNRSCGTRTAYDTAGTTDPAGTTDAAGTADTAGTADECFAFATVPGQRLIVAVVHQYVVHVLLRPRRHLIKPSGAATAPAAAGASSIVRCVVSLTWYQQVVDVDLGRHARAQHAVHVAHTNTTARR